MRIHFEFNEKENKKLVHSLIVNKQRCHTKLIYSCEFLRRVENNAKL